MKTKKSNTPDDPTTWEEGVKIFARRYKRGELFLCEFVYFSGFGDDDNLPYYTNMGRFREAIIATPNMIKGYDKIQHKIDVFYQR